MATSFVRLGLMAALTAGCGAPDGVTRHAMKTEAAPAAGADYSQAYGAAKQLALAEPTAPDAAMGAMGGMMGGQAQPPQDAPPADANLARKIIYDAQIDLVIDDIDPTAQKLVDLVTTAGGYLAEQNVSGSPGTQRSGRWKIRVPVDRFEGFVKDLIALGELERNLRTSQDVTAEFYDFEARIRNKKVEEATLVKILEERGGKLEDVLKVEVELARVRGEVEQMEGRLRVLANLASLATVTVNLRERVKYEPPEPVVAGFGTQLQRAWADSIKAFTEGVQGFLLWLARNWINILFWVFGLIVALVVARVLIRRLIRHGPRLWELARAPLNPPPFTPPGERSQASGRASGGA